MQHALQLGFQSVINLRRFAVTPRNLRAGELVFLNARAIGSKRLLSNSPAPVSSSIVMNKTDKKPKGSMDRNPHHEKGVFKENIAKSELVPIQSIREEPGKIEAMTVQELRTTLRSVGAPAKGCKSDLVSALKCYLDNNVNGAEDESFQAAEEHVSSEMKPNSTEAVSSKRKFKKISDKIIKVNTKIVTTEQKLSIKIDEVPGKKRSRAKREANSEISGEDFGAAGSS
ncbi:hypothetical protein L1049_007771 [Liquidambar formosana]|uniref:SAP domain-containing protein n=1 Tax=Liquidambar formosana TaxID=63359 RepID=A0AAP0X1U3_LIQFO